MVRNESIETCVICSKVQLSLFVGVKSSYDRYPGRLVDAVRVNNASQFNLCVKILSSHCKSACTTIA